MKSCMQMGIIAASCCFGTEAGAQISEGMYAIQDAFVSEDYPAPNCDNSLFLGDIVGSESWIYMQFDIRSKVPAGAQLLDVEIELERVVTSSTNGGMSTVFSRANTTWTDCVIGWGTEPDPLIVSLGPSNQVIPLPNGVYPIKFHDDGSSNLGLLNHFQMVLDGVRPQDGIVLVPVNPSGYVVFSDIDHGSGPYLRVTYEMADQPPEVSVTQAGNDIPDGGTFSFGIAEDGNPITKSFTITNLGEQALNLGLPSFTGPFVLDDSQFGWEPILSGGSSSVFFVRWMPSAINTNEGSMSFYTNDPDENPFNFDFVGYFSELLQINSPAGGEEWVSGESRQLTWTSSTAIDSTIEIQFSANGGNTWEVVKLDAPNTGVYDWIVPIDFSNESKMKVIGTAAGNVHLNISNEFTIAASPESVGDSFSGNQLDSTIWNGEIDYIVGDTQFIPNFGTLNDGVFSMLAGPLATGSAPGFGVQIESLDRFTFGRFGARMMGAGDAIDQACETGLVTGFFLLDAEPSVCDNNHEIDVEIETDHNGNGLVRFVVWLRNDEQTGERYNIFLTVSEHPGYPGEPLDPCLSFHDYEIEWIEDNGLGEHAVRFYIDGFRVTTDAVANQGKDAQNHDMIQELGVISEITEADLQLYVVPHMDCTPQSIFPDRASQLILNHWYVGATNTANAKVAGVYLPASSSHCVADITGDGTLDFFDVSAFLTAFAQQDPVTDFTDDGNFDFFDVSAFLQAFSTGCP